MAKFMVEVDVPSTVGKGTHSVRYITECEVFNLFEIALRESKDSLFSKASILEVHPEPF